MTSLKLGREIMLKLNSFTFLSILLISVSSYGDFSIVDELNDDKGAGDILYPANSRIIEGELDLIRFDVKKRDDSHQLIFEFRKPLSSPKNQLSSFGGNSLSEILKHDFHTVNVDVYIDTDRKRNSGFKRTLPGRQVLLANEFSWEKAIIVTPRPYAAQSMQNEYLVKTHIENLSNSEQTLDSQISAKIEQDIELQMQKHYLFATKIKVKKNKLIVTIPNLFISEFSADWAYSVLISAATTETSYQSSIDSPNFILLTQPGRNKDSLGLKAGARRNASPIVDVLDSHAEQKQWLNNLLLDETTQRYFSVLGAVVPSKIGEKYTGKLTKPNMFSSSDVQTSKDDKSKKLLTIEERLNRLQQLRDKKLVSEGEYKNIRIKILESL
jgi:hypothetical protein